MDARPTWEGTVRRRATAFVLDTALVGGVSAAVASDRTSSTTGTVVSTVLLASTLGFLYHVVLEGWRGQTVGKRLRGIVVVRVDGTPASYDDAFRRTAGRLVDALPFGYLVGLIAIALTDRNQRVGDLLADTVVVRTDRDDPSGSVARRPR